MVGKGKADFTSGGVVFMLLSRNTNNTDTFKKGFFGRDAGYFGCMRQGGPCEEFGDMSVENLKEYARRCASEPELAAEAKAIGLEDLEGQMRYAGSLGLEWTEDDLATFRRDVVGAEGELEDIADEELSKVAGGLMTVTAAIVAGAVAGGVVAGAAAAAAGAVATTQSTGSGSW